MTVTVHAPAASDRIDIVGDCTPQMRHSLLCRDQDRPNIVLIVTDDQRWDTLPYMPNVLSLLANQGVTFTNSFVTTSICCPSRASGLSGLYAHNHGVLANVLPEGGAPKFVGPDSSTIATWFARRRIPDRHVRQVPDRIQRLGAAVYLHTVYSSWLGRMARARQRAVLQL